VRGLTRLPLWLAALAVLFLCGYTAVAADEWRELRSDAFSVQVRPEHEEDALYAIEVLRKFAAELRPRLPLGDEPVRVVICHSYRDYRRAAGAHALVSVMGLARPQEGVIIMKSPSMMPRGDFRGVLRHELVHILLYRNTDTYAMPKWLNEGLAMMLSGEKRWNSSIRVGQMKLRNEIIPYRDLQWVLTAPGVEPGFGDAYAQSLSMARRLRSVLGEEGLWALVFDLRDMSFGDALRKHADMDPLDFFEDWRTSTWGVALIFWSVSGFSAFHLMVVLLILAYIRKRRRGKRLMAAWEEEEMEDDRDMAEAGSR
jgi:hypothetical protein